MVRFGSAALAIGLFAADASAAPGWNSATYRRNSFNTISSLAEADAAIGSGILLGSGVTAAVNDREVDGGGGGGNFNGDVEPFGMVAGDDNDFTVLHTGFLNITVSGNYTFTNNTDDGSRLRLDLNQDGIFGVGETVINDDVLSNPHDAHSALMGLTTGVYRIEHTWFERVGGGEGELGIRLDTSPGLHLIGDKNQDGFQFTGAFVDTLSTDGDFITYPQASWGDSNPGPTNGAGQLLAHYGAVYPFLSGPFEVGRPGVSTFSLVFTDSGSVINYLPASGPDGPLTSDVINPVTTAAGGFGGEVTALNLNVDFSDAHFTLGSRGIPFGDLELHDTQTIYDGFTVRELLDQANSSLGGGSAFPNIAGLSPLVKELNAAFNGGHVSPWAFTYLRVVAGITGDYNANGIVDAADYTVWRDHLGQTFTLSNENSGAMTPGLVDAEDYAFWKSHFGEGLAGSGAGSGAGASVNAAVPEPTSLVLLIFAAPGLCSRRARAA